MKEICVVYSNSLTGIKFDPFFNFHPSQLIVLTIPVMQATSTGEFSELFYILVD